MFNLKNIVSKITDRGRDSQPNSPGVSDDPLNNQGAEGFLCPKCMTAYPSPEELQAHYEEQHNSVEGDPVGASGAAGFSSLHQEAGSYLHRQNQGAQSVNQERLSAEIYGITNIGELQKSLMDALESRNQLQFEKESLEQRTAQLARVNAAMKSVNDEEQGKTVALKERLKILEDQLAHRESIDDASVLRQELVQVQRVMDEMTRERERERDVLQTELQKLKTAFESARHSASAQVAELQMVIKKEEATKLQKDKSQNELEKTKQTELHSEISALKSNITELNASSETYAQAVQQLQDQVKMLKSEAATLKTSLQEKSLESENLARELHSKATDNEALLAKIDSLTNAQTHTASLIKDKDERLAKLAADLKKHASDGAGAAKAAVQQLADENEARIRETVAANEKLILEKEASDEAAARAKNECSDKEAKIYDLQKKFEGCNEKIQELTTEILEINTRSDTLISHLQASVEKCDTQSKELVTLQQASQLLQERINLKEEHCTNLEMKMELLEEECRAAEEEKKRMEVTRASLETDMFELQKSLTVLETESQDNVQDLRDEIMNLCTNLEIRTQTLHLRERELGQSQEALLKEAADRAADLAARDAASERLRVTTDALIEEMSKQVEDKQRHIESLKSSQADMEAEMKMMENTKKELEQQVESLTESMGKLQKDLDSQTETVGAQIAQRLEIEKNKNAEIQAAKKEMKEVLSKHEKELAELKKNLEMKTEKLKEMQNSLDEVTSDKLVLEAHLQTSQTEQKTLMEKYYASSSDNETQRRNLDEFRRRCEDSQSGLHELGRENQILRMELEKLLGRKWTEDSDVASCHLCHKEFSMLVRKHHCRNCGQIFCNECSSKSAPVANNKKPVRVCDGCYNELAAAM